MESTVKRVQNFFCNYGSADFDQLARIYDPSAVFQDPVHRIEGLPSIRAYFDAGRRGLLSCNFNFSSDVSCDNRATLVWRMDYAHRRLRGGKKLSLDGCSVIAFDQSSGLVLEHRDYFDMGAMLYEHIPCLGQVVGRIKQTLTT